MEPLHPTDPPHIGTYKLTARLGTGGMGRVYLARTPSGRQLVIKVIHPELAREPGFRARFAREADAARRVGGFHTAQAIAADPDADAPWIATAHIPGPTLDRAVRDHGPLTPPALYVLAAGLAEGLQAIHACDLVHRDLKPGNIILADDGPRIIDFGIARPLDADSMTTHGAVFGTLPYMSPEQTDGSRVGPASDVFSLGTVLAFAATGTSPFSGATMAQTLRRIISPPPDPGPVDTLTRDLIRQCWNHDPAQRPTPDRILARLGTLDLHDSWPPPGTDATVAYTRPVGAPPPAASGDRGPAPSAQDIPTTEQVPWPPPDGPPSPEPEPGPEPGSEPGPEADAPAQTAVEEPPAAPEPAPAPHPDPTAPAAAAPRRAGGDRPRRNNLLAVGAAVVSVAAIGGLIAWDTSNGRASFDTDAPSGESPPPGDEASTGEEPSQAIAVLEGHSDAVNTVAFSPDSATLATGGDDDTVKLWDLATGTEVISLDGHGDRVSSVAFSPDGTTLASGSGDDTVRLWDVETGEHIETLEHTGSVLSVAFSPDGNLLATGDTNRGARLWHVASGEEAAVLDGHSRRVNSVAFSPDGDTLVTGDDETARFWDVATGERTATITGLDKAVYSLAFSPEGDLLATGTDFQVRLWDIDSGEGVSILACDVSASSVAFSPDGATLAGSDCGSVLTPILMWDVATEEEIFLGDPGKPANSVAFSPDGTALATGHRDGTARLWELD